MKTKSGHIEKRILKAGIFVSVAHLLFRLAGLIQAKVMGHYLPDETLEVVYTFAFENCLFMVFLIGEELLASTFLPVFMSERDKESESSAWVFASTLLTIQFIVLLAVTAVFLVAPDFVVKMLTSWRAESSPEKYALAVSSVRTMAPALIGLSLGSTTYALLNGHKRFFLAALGDAAWKFCVIAVLLGGVLLKKDGAQLLIWGIIAGAACKVLTHLFGLRDKLSNIRPTLAFSHPAMKRLALLMLPLLLGVLITKVRDNYNNVQVLSVMEAGLMKANSFGKKLQSTLAFIVPSALSIAVFPFFCEMVDNQDQRKMGDLVTRFGRMMLAVFAPFALFVAILAVPLTSLIFKGGHFDDTAVQRTAVSLACYTFVLPAAAIEPLMNKAFFASRRMLSATVIGVVFSLMSIGISWLGLKAYAHTGDALVLLAFIAGGFTLTRILKCVALVEILKRKIPVFPFVETTLFLARVIIAAGLAGGAAWLLLRQLATLHILSGRIGDIAKLGVCAAAFTGIYFVGAYLLRIREIRELLDLVVAKLRKRKA